MMMHGNLLNIPTPHHKFLGLLEVGPVEYVGSSEAEAQCVGNNLQLFCCDSSNPPTLPSARHTGHCTAISDGGSTACVSMMQFLNNI